MKLSFIFELLLIFILIAFAASAVIGNANFISVYLVLFLIAENNTFRLFRLAQILERLFDLGWEGYRIFQLCTWCVQKRITKGGKYFSSEEFETCYLQELRLTYYFEVTPYRLIC